jgi:hypothetical protein
MPLYQYVPLENPYEDIRLLILRCQGRSNDEIAHFKLPTRVNLPGRVIDAIYGSSESSEPGPKYIWDLPVVQEPAYDALSYTWDLDAEKDLFLSIRGRKLAIQPNLANALRRLRPVPCPVECTIGCVRCSRRLWVDAVCINQANPHELGAQISIMSSIYSSSSRCFVWLGQAAPSARLAFEFLDWLARNIDFEDNRAPTKDSIRFFNLQAGQDLPSQAIHNILQRRWFNRLWVVSERIENAFLDL